MLTLFLIFNTSELLDKFSNRRKSMYINIFVGFRFICLIQSSVYQLTIIKKSTFQHTVFNLSYKQLVTMFSKYEGKLHSAEEVLFFYCKQ